MEKIILSLDEFINESKAGKDFELKDLKPGMKIKVENHAGFYQDAQIISIKGNMIYWEAADGDTGNTKYGNPEISLPTYESFNSEESIFEAMDLSDDLKKVKTPEELVYACLNKYLIIHSKHEIRNTNKRGGSWPRMYIIRGFGKTIKLDDVGYSIHGSDIDIFAYDYTGWSVKWTPEDIFDFFMFNRKRGNKIYTVSEIPIAKEMQKIADKLRETKHEINSLLGSDVSDVVGKRSVMAASYVVTGETQSHGERYMEFTADRKDYTYFWNVYSYEPSLINRRGISKIGWDRNQYVYRVSPSTASKILKLVNELIELYNDAKKTMSNYYKSEKINPK